MGVSAVPGESNVFGSLDAPGSPERAAQLFVPFGWQARTCSWTDYEIVCEFAELVIEPFSQKPNHLLIHGPVADVLANLSRVTEPLVAAGISYSLECYNTHRDLIHHARG